jgi:hypothetical protein
VLIEHRPKGYQADWTGPSLAEQAAGRLVPAETAEPVFYALGDEGSWAVQTEADDGILPQWSVLERCQRHIEQSGPFWPAALPPPHCRLFRGPIAVLASQAQD